MARGAAEATAGGAALAANECAVTEDETAEVFGREGFDAEFARAELGWMVLDGTAFLEGGRILRVRAGECPPAALAPTPAQRLRQMVVDGGCRPGETEARAAGFDAAATRAVVRRWDDEGRARVERRTLVMDDCR